MSHEPLSPSTSSTFLPFLSARSRRGSLASITSRREFDRDALAEALDHIHGTASKSGTLTSFHDFDGGAGKTGAGNGAKELVTTGVSNLYNRFRSSVSQASSPVGNSGRPGSKAGRDSNPSVTTSSKTSSRGVKTVISADDKSSRSPKSAGKAQSLIEVASPSQAEQVRNKTTKTRTPLDTSSDSDSIRRASRLMPPSPKTRSLERLSSTASQLTQTTMVPDDYDMSSSVAPVRALNYQEDKPATMAPRSTQSMPTSAQSNARKALSRASSQLSTNSKSSAPRRDTAQRPAMVHVGVSHLPGFQPSEHSTPTAEDPPILPPARPPLTTNALEPSPNLNSALQRKRSGLRQDGTAPALTGLPSHLKRRVISKEFWMKDENAKVCFDCGQSFSTFRRKHHCRTCGQIFDAKCTSLVPGIPFGQTGTLRLCKPCEDIIFGSSGDDSSILTEDAEDAARRHSLLFDDDLTPPNGIDAAALEQAGAATPTIGIPVSRRNREAKRRSAVIEFDAQPGLARPTSSRSLISLTGRPRSISHKRHPSRAQQFRTSKSREDDVPYPEQDGSADVAGRNSLPAFHNDNIIDPDLALYLSDEYSEDEPQPNIMAALHGDADSTLANRERIGLSTPTSALEKRSRIRSRDNLTKDDDAQSIISRRASRLSRRGTPSISSIHAFKSSPRHSRSNRHLRESITEDTHSPPSYHSSDCLKMERSAKLHGPSAHMFGFNQASYEHVRKMLLQMLDDAKVEQAATWEKALLPILLRCTSDVNPDVPKGDEMDIRHYIKLKKVPGGRPGDTSYISGVAFSKQIALKSMSRNILNPRIAIVTFPIEYARHQSHFMSLEPVIAQEQEYLSNLVNRIAALRPQLLLVQRNVSGLALSLLDRAGITVAFNIKESVLAAVARVTRTTMIKSIDKLTIDPRHLGRCDGFSVKTYVHNASRKTYIVLSGCQPDLGCTILLRGAELPVLRKIKRVTEFMCFVVYNLRLETHFMRDEFASIPTDLVDQLAPLALLDPASTTPTTLLSDVATQSEYATMERRAQSRILSASPFIVYMQPHLLTQLRSTEQKLAEFDRLNAMYAAADATSDPEKESMNHFELIQPEMVCSNPSPDQPKSVREYLHAVHKAQFDRTSITFDHQRKLWQGFLATSSDPFDPLSHQTIVVLHSIVSSITSAPCVGPELLGVGFYAGFNHADPDLEEDFTLGQYVEDVCLGAADTCKECSRKMLEHYRQYVHGQGQLSVSVARQASRLSGMSNVILMWSTCKRCHAETPVLPMSDSTWKYSFAKYLELSFWSRPLQPRARVCGHDLHKDFVRCFGFHDLVVKVQYDPIEIYDIIVPRNTIFWNVVADLTIKNTQYQRFEKRLEAFIDSVKNRLNTINVDTLDEKQLMQAQSTIESLREHANQDHDELLLKLQDKYSSSRYYELTPLNRALRFMEEKALWWDETFNNFESDYFPSETDIRKLAAAQLKEMFYGSQSSTDSMISEVSDDEGGSELASLPSRLADEQSSVNETTSDEKTEHVLASIAHESRSEGSIVDDLGAKPDGVAHEMQAENHDEKKDRTADCDTHAIPLDIHEHRDSSDIELGRAITKSVVSPTRTASSDSALAQRVEQIRASDSRPAIAGTDTKIPRLQTLRPREDQLISTETSAPSKARQQASQSLQSTSTKVSNQDRPPQSPSNPEGPSLERRLQDRIGRLSSKIGSFPPSLIPRSIPIKSENGSSNTVSSLAKHFEHLSREFEKERLRERRLRASKNRQARANPLASSRPVVEIYKSATEAVGEHKSDPKEKSTSHEQTAPNKADNTTINAEQAHEAVVKHTPSRQPSPSSSLDHREGQGEYVNAGIGQTDASSQSHEVATNGSQTEMTASVLSMPGDSDLDLHPDLTIPDHKRNAWFKVLAEFWSKRSASGWANLEYPLYSTEHVFEDSDIIVREDEPSSIIALSLASADYLNKVKEFRSVVPLTRKNTQSSDSAAEVNEAIEASLLKDTGTHMKYSFSHGQFKASCKIFYAEAFDALRRRCRVADRFVESMSRCMKYDSKGGKTKSLFLKTLDNRFIIKSLQEVEVKAFTKFAPDYFAFMSHTLFRSLPSVIAKMFGLFQVTVKNPITGMEFNYYLLVMENLFYDHTPNRRFDLKGSMRNRKIESTGQPDEVLLDENLVETIFESPLFVREHSRRLLQASVWNDTLWLCKQNVMDYSLMAGFEDEARELVVGIIDCIRTYTWDKKLESWIKDRGKNKPTITSPKDYRNRFRVSMMQYVLQAPNCWHQFQASMALPKTLKEKDDGAVAE